MGALLVCQVCGDSGDPKGASGVRIVSVKRLGLACVCERCGQGAVDAQPLTPEERADKKRARRNRLARERAQAMRDLGMVRTPYGWE